MKRGPFSPRVAPAFSWRGISHAPCLEGLRRVVVDYRYASQIGRRCDGQTTVLCGVTTPNRSQHEQTRPSLQRHRPESQTGPHPGGVLPPLRSRLSPGTAGGGQAPGVLPLHRHGFREDPVRAALPAPGRDPDAGRLGQAALLQARPLRADAEGGRGAGQRRKARGAGAPDPLLALHAHQQHGRGRNGDPPHPGRPRLPSVSPSAG